MLEKLFVFLYRIEYYEEVKQYRQDKKSLEGKFISMILQQTNKLFVFISVISQETLFFVISVTLRLQTNCFL